MKKLLVVALSALMVLAFAAVSMAAVTVTGESNFGWNMSPDKDQDQFGNAKVAFTADVTDSMQIFTAFKGDVGTGVNVDEAWVSFKADTLTTKVGYFGFGLDGDVDILPSINEVKQDAGISVSAKTSDAITVAGYLARFGDNVGVAGDDPLTPEEEQANEMQNIYAFSVAYDADAFGGKLAYVGTTVDDINGIMVLSGYYKMDAFKVYLEYESVGKQTVNDYDLGSQAVLGATYDGEAFYARVETQVQPYKIQDDSDWSSNMGFRLGYKLSPNAKIEYNSKTIGFEMGKSGNLPDGTASIATDDPDTVSSIKLCVTF